MKQKPQKLTRPKEYRTPKTLPWERTAELYGEQAMSLGQTRVKEYNGLGGNK